MVDGPKLWMFTVPLVFKEYDELLEGPKWKSLGQTLLVSVWGVGCFVALEGESYELCSGLLQDFGHG